MRRSALVIGVTATLFAAVIFGTQAAGHWNNMLLLMHSKSFGVDDPLFHQDIGFYVFRLPVFNFIAGWSLGMVILTVLAVGAVYIGRLALGGFSQTSRAARPHLSLLLVTMLGLFICRYWLHRYALVFSSRGAAFGAAYTDVHAQLPVTYVLMALAAVTAIAIFVSIFQRRLLFLPIGATVVWVVGAIAGGLIYPAAVQRFRSIRTR